MRRVVIDTNIYIGWFNAGRHEDLLFQRDAVKHLSVVVLMEFRAGGVFAEAGDVLRRLQARRGFRLETSRSIVNDVLIALSARSIGATVVTQNAGHYRAIQAVRPFPLVVVGEDASGSVG